MHIIDRTIFIGYGNLWSRNLVGVLGKSVDFITYSCRWMTEK